MAATLTPCHVSYGQGESLLSTNQSTSGGGGGCAAAPGEEDVMKCRCSVPGKQTGFLSCSSEQSGKSAQPRTLPGFLLLAVVQDNRQENQQPLLADRVTPDFETTTTTGRTARTTEDTHEWVSQFPIQF